MKLKLGKIDTNNEHPAGWFTAEYETPAEESKDGRRVVVPGTMKPLDIESLPLEEQAIAQVLADEVEKAEKAGIEEPTINLTRAKVKAKLKELKKQKRRQKQSLKTEYRRH